MTNKSGNLVTRLLGRLVIKHNMGTVEFELRNPTEIRRRGTRTVLLIEGLGEIPRLEDGMSINLDALYQGNIKVSFIERHDDNGAEVSPDRRGECS